MNTSMSEKACAITVASAILGIGLFTSFHPPLNDFWGNLFLAQHLEFGDIATWHDGFFPFGYTLLLKLSPTDLFPPVFGYVLNALLMVPFMLALLNAASRYGMNKWWKVTFAVAAYLFPRLFHYYAAPGADFGSAVFFSVGALLVLRAAAIKGRNRLGWLLISGVLLGLSALWRYHGLAAGVLFLISAFVFSPQARRQVLVVSAVMILVFSPQVIASIVAGEGLLGTYQYFNIYKSFHDINWYRAGELSIPRSFVAVIAENPAEFLSSWGVSFVKIGLVAWIPACALFVLRKDMRNEVLIWGLFGVLYSAVVAVADSGRAVLLLLPVSILFALMSFQAFTKTALIRNTDWLQKATYTLLAVGLGVFLVRDVQKVVSWRSQMKTYLAIEKKIVAHGITSGDAIYSTDYDQYFRTIRRYRPIMSGGWLALDEYSEMVEHQAPSLSSEKEFFSDCRRLGIRVLCLGPDSPRAAPFLGAMYHRFSSGSAVLLSEHGDLKLFTISEKQP